MNKTFIPARCKRCNVQFQPVDWMLSRVLGYCDAACQKAAELAVKLPAADSPAEPLL